jgi:hypothetical protein
MGFFQLALSTTRSKQNDRRVHQEAKQPTSDGEFNFADVRHYERKYSEAWVSNAADPGRAILAGDLGDHDPSSAANRMITSLKLSPGLRRAASLSMVSLGTETK